MSAKNSRGLSDFVEEPENTEDLVAEAKDKFLKHTDPSQSKSERQYEAAQILADVFRFVNVRFGEDESDSLYIYNPETKLWESDCKRYISEVVAEGMEEHYDGSTESDIEERIIADETITEQELGHPEGEIPVENGILDLETRELRSIQPEDYITRVLPVEYDPDAEAERFENFLNVVVNNEEDRKKLMEYAGYILHHWYIPYHKILFITGPTASGKSTFIDVIESLLPDEQVSASSLTQLSDKFGAENIHGKLLNSVADISQKDIESTHTFKLLTSGDPVDADIKYRQDPKRFRPTAKHIFSSNKLFQMFCEDEEEAFWRRILLVEFPNSIDDGDQLRGLSDSLKEEKSGILNMALDGYERLFDDESGNGGFTNDRDIEETRTAWRRNGNSVMSFYAERLKKDIGSKEAKKEVYSEYKDFCEGRDLKEYSRQKFGDRLTKLSHIDPVNGDHKRKQYENIRLTKADGG